MTLPRQSILTIPFTCWCPALPLEARVDDRYLEEVIDGIGREGCRDRTRGDCRGSIVSYTRPMRADGARRDEPLPGRNNGGIGFPSNGKLSHS